MSVKVRPSSCKSQRRPQSGVLPNKQTIPVAEGLVGPKYQTKSRTLTSSIIEHQRVKPKDRPKTEGNQQNIRNPESQDFAPQVKESKKALFIDPKQVQLPNSRYDKVKTEPSEKVEAPRNQACVLENAQKSTLDKMVAMSIQYHDPCMCVCSYCTCGRHLCKVHPWKKPSLINTTLYQREFSKKNPFTNANFRPGTPYLERSPAVDPYSTYTKDYPAKKVELDSQFHPTETLEVGGPLNALTTYGSAFPGYKTSPMEPIKAGGGEVFQGFPFKAASTYQKQFAPKQTKLIGPMRTQGNFKLGEAWMGTSTYRDNFAKPNISYTSGWRSKLGKMPEAKFSHQFDTTYRNNFIAQRSQVCPAIAELKSRSNFYRNSRRTNQDNKTEAEKLLNSTS